MFKYINMGNYNIIVAMCDNNGIGYKNSLPWKNSEDLKRFAKLTKGNGNNAIVMGRKTWESLPYKPLKGRYNIVISKSSSNYLGDKMFSDIDKVYEYCEKLYNDLKPLGLLQFVRSGRISVTKEKMGISVSYG